MDSNTTEKLELAVEDKDVPGIVMVDVMATGRDRRKVPAPPVSSSSSNGDDDEKEVEEPADPNIYMVEAIQGQRMVRGKLEYLVKWENYPKEDNTWEPATGLFCYDLIEEFQKTRKQKTIKSEKKGSKRKSETVQVSSKTGEQRDSGADRKKDEQEEGTQKEVNRAAEPAKASDKKPTGSTEKTEKKASQVIEKNGKKASEPVGKVDGEPVEKTEKKGSEIKQKKEEARPARQDEPLPGPSHRLDRDPRRGSSSPKKKKVIKITKPGRSGLVKGWRVQDIVAVCKEEGADDDADFRFVVKYKERDGMEAIPRQECNARIPHKVIKFYEMNVIWAQILEDL